MDHLPLTPDGCWCEPLTPRRGEPVPALFLDRDGTLIEERHFLSAPEGVVLQPGGTGLIRSAKRAGLAVILVTNQSGIGRGYYDWIAFAKVQSRLAELLRAEDAPLDMVLACPYHPKGVHPYDAAAHPWRKPAPGMLRGAARALNLDPSRSWMVGDKVEDIEAAIAAGLAGAVHLLTGHGVEHRARVAALAPPPGFTLHLAADPVEAACSLRNLFG